MEQRVRVLIADDRPTTRQGLRALLSLLPQVEIIAEAANGCESVDLVAEYRPDVVLMDMHMPVMDGVEATRRIKEQWPTVRIIALTLHSQYRAEALAAGVDVFLLKDGNADTLLDAIMGQVDGFAATSPHDALSG
jgi:DNA-binding NarL/FixJ family response regulator